MEDRAPLCPLLWGPSRFLTATPPADRLCRVETCQEQKVRESGTGLHPALPSPGWGRGRSGEDHGLWGVTVTRSVPALPLV